MSMAPSARVPGLDLLRIFACVAVVLFHLTCRGNAPDSFMIPSYPSLAPFTSYGFLGVELFFMISGYVICETGNTRSARSFFAARASRLLPAFWICCSLTYLVMRQSEYPSHAISIAEYVINMTMLGGWLKTKPADSSYWSLLVEMHFYFLFLILLACGLAARLRQFAALWLLLSVMLLLLPVKLGNFFLIPYWSAHFIAGIGFWIFHRTPHRAWGAGLVALSFPIACILLIQRLPGLESLLGRAYNPVVAASILLIMYCLMLAALRWHPASKKRWLLIAAGSTYPLYLIHQNAGYVLMNQLIVVLSTTMTLIITLLAVGLLSVAIHVYAESPLSRRLRGALEGKG
jgi:peptidoglycan/LPS O-acetylase OafA/YrhL